MESLLESAAVLQALKAKAADLDTELKATRAQIDDIESVMTAAMVADDVQSFNHMGYTFSLTARTHASVPAEIMPDFIRRVRARKFGGIVKTTILPQTLTAFVKEQRDVNGGQTPAWMDKFVRLYITNAISVRKSNK